MDRSSLRFVEAVQDAFRFLSEEYGFRLATLAAPTFVRYESTGTFLNVYHGRISYEINVQVGRIADPPGPSYGLSDVLSALLSQEDRPQTYFQASKPLAVKRCVDAVAELVARHYGSLLKGDDEVFRRVAAQTTETSRVLTNEVVRRPVKEAAEKAWRAKQYARVRELYGSIRDGLSPVEHKRLEYAEKHHEDEPRR